MVLWFVGMSGAGKTLLSSKVYEILKSKIPNLVLLDGDALREVYQGDIDHSVEGRRVSHERFSRLSKMLADQDIHVIGATLSIFHDLQEWNRENLKDYCQVYVKVPMEVLRKREIKGLYAGAFEGKIKNVVGVDIEFKDPIHNDLIIDNSKDMDNFDPYIEEILNLPQVKKLL